jgi:hypothetical protein
MKNIHVRTRFPSTSPLRSLHFALFLVCLLFSIYTISYVGKFRVDDEHILAARSQSLVLWGRLEEPQVAGNTRVRTLIAYGDQATQIEPMLSLVGTFILGPSLKLRIGGMQALLTTNIYVTVLCALVVFSLVRVLEFGDQSAFLCALAFGAASMAWPYASTYYRDPLVMLMAASVMAGLALFLYHDNFARRLGLAVMLFGLVGGILTKNSMLALVPALSLGLFYESFRAARWKRLVVFCLVLAAGLVIFPRIIPPTGPLARFSWDYYKELGKHFVGSLRLGAIAAVAGPFISPSSSIVLFTPVLALVPSSLKRFWKRYPAWSLSAITFPLFLAIAQALFYGDRWMGDFGWGLRYMLPALPGLFGILAIQFERIRKGTAASLLAVLVGVGALIQLSGAIVNWTWPYELLGSIGRDLFRPAAGWSIRDLAIPYQIFGLFSPQQWSVAWFRTSARSLPAALVPIIAMALLLGSIAVWKRFRKNGNRSSGSALRWLALGSTVLPLICVGGLLKHDPYWGRDIKSVQQGIKFIAEHIGSEDIVIVDSYGTTLWNAMMNQWSKAVPWASLPYQIVLGDLGSGEVEPKFQILTGYIPDGLYSLGMLWYIESDQAPDYLYNEERAWLSNNYHACQLQVFKDEVIVEIREFSLGSCP